MYHLTRELVREMSLHDGANIWIRGCEKSKFAAW
jgi:hypothetical protein